MRECSCKREIVKKLFFEKVIFFWKKVLIFICLFCLFCSTGIKAFYRIKKFKIISIETELFLSKNESKKTHKK